MEPEQYVRLNVQVGEDSAAGCCSSKKYYVLSYIMSGKESPQWNIVPVKGEFRVEFRATGQGTLYGHSSDPFSQLVKQHMEKNTQKSTKDVYQVRIEQRSGFDLRRYFH
ncbi:uncharacterized protein LOC124150740 isoform X2 [Haliotis rufescens]|nr:uncharacterized protein LOC124150740 isoform X2 [Haliotis rufescens]